MENCFRCLASNHQGKDCKRARECGVDGCKRNHDKHLHQSGENQARKKPVVDDSPNPTTLSTRVFATVSNEEATVINSEQVIEEHSLITTLASSQNQDNVYLPTVPVWLSANGKKINVTLFWVMPL